MNEVWNSWDLKPPPVCTVKTELNLKEISLLKQVTHNALKTVKNLRVLDREAAYLSRFLYKYRRIFRHDKGMRNLVKVNQCLKRYLKLDLKGVLVGFEECLPSKLSAVATHAYLPTRQMLKWVLLRIQAFSQIFARVLYLTKQTGAYVYQKLFLGWAVNLSVMVFCLTARIMVLSKFLVAKSFEWYSSFHSSLPFLKETAAFLPEYTPPADLKKWQGPVDLTPLKKKTLIDRIFELTNLTGEDEDADNDQIQIMNEKILKIFKTSFRIGTDTEEMREEDTKEEERGIKRPLQASLNEDLGVPVIDEEEDSYKPTKKKRKKGKRIKQ